MDLVGKQYTSNSRIQACIHDFMCDIEQMTRGGNPRFYSYNQEITHAILVPQIAHRQQSYMFVENNLELSLVTILSMPA